MTETSIYNSVLSLSGGLDSGVLLSQVLQVSKSPPEKILCVSFRYKSKHNNKESEAAFKIAEHYGCPLRVIDVHNIVDPFGTSALSEVNKTEVPEGHYAEETMRQTVVPGRNLIFASILAGLAESLGAKTVFLGTHAGDHYIYPDCRPVFLLTLKEAVRMSSDERVTIFAPFVSMNKAEIVKIGRDNKFPFELSWTCYKGGEKACGKCGSCQERLEAFSLNNKEDPLVYEGDRTLIPKV